MIKNSIVLMSLVGVWAFTISVIYFVNVVLTCNFIDREIMPACKNGDIVLSICLVFIASMITIFNIHINKVFDDLSKDTQEGTRNV
jgi:hypothetical protein